MNPFNTNLFKTHKQKLLEQHLHNLRYLEQQAAQYGLEVPLALHNALVAEQEAVATLEEELAALEATPLPSGPAHHIAVIDADDHWRKIIVKIVQQLGGCPVEWPVLTPDNYDTIIESCAVAVVSVPPHTQTDSLFITEVIANLGSRLPLILLVDWANRGTAILLRQAIRDYNIDIAPVTIFKETFDAQWFGRVVRQFLAR